MPYASKEARRVYEKAYYEKNKAKGWNRHLLSETEEKRAARLEAMRQYQLKRNFGLSSEQYTKMLLEQDGKCYLCKKPPSAKSGRHGKVADLAVDHCHSTGKIRRLLCATCNMKLGWYERNKDQINEYLEAGPSACIQEN